MNKVMHHQREKSANCFTKMEMDCEIEISIRKKCPKSYWTLLKNLYEIKLTEI